MPIIYAVSPNNQAATDVFRDRKLGQYRADEVSNLMISGFSV